MKQRLINEIRFPVSALILTRFFWCPPHLRIIWFSHLSHILPIIERVETTSKSSSRMTTRLKMTHPESIILWEKIINVITKKAEEKKYEKYGQMPFQNSNIFHDNVHRLQIREKWARKTNFWIPTTYRNPT